MILYLLIPWLLPNISRSSAMWTQIHISQITEAYITSKAYITDISIANTMELRQFYTEPPISRNDMNCNSKVNKAEYLPFKVFCIFHTFLPLNFRNIAQHKLHWDIGFQHTSNSNIIFQRNQFWIIQSSMNNSRGISIQWNSLNSHIMYNTSIKPLIQSSPVLNLPVHFLCTEENIACKLCQYHAC